MSLPHSGGQVPAGPAGQVSAGRPAGESRDGARRRGYRLTAGVLLVMLLGGTLPVPLYVLYEAQMGFGPLGVTVVFAAYVAGTLVVLLGLGDLSDHIGRRPVELIAVACAAASTVLFLAASSIGWLIAARVASGAGVCFVTGTAAAGPAELQPRGDRQAAAVVASGTNMAGLGLGPLVAGLFAEYVAMPTKVVFWAYLGACALMLAAGFQIDQFPCLDTLWHRESGWNYTATNSGSGAFGIPQALPGSKMAKFGDDWETNPATQIKWGLDYIEGRYDTPCGAWEHSQNTGWY